MRLAIELSGENLPLARAELGGAAAAISGSEPSPSYDGTAAFYESKNDISAQLARRLALAWRVCEVHASAETIEEAIARLPSAVNGKLTARARAKRLTGSWRP